MLISAELVRDFNLTYLSHKRKHIVITLTSPGLGERLSVRSESIPRSGEIIGCRALLSLPPDRCP